MTCHSREHEQGTFDQLLLTPISTLEILIGKVLPELFYQDGRSHF